MKNLHVIVGRFFMCGIVALASIALFHDQATSQASYGQQIAAMKIVNPNLKSIGVFGSALSDKSLQDITRAGLGQGVEIVVGRPKNAREISAIYKKMVSEKQIQIVWLPDAEDILMLGVGFEFLRSTTLPDKIGLCVPNQSMLASGGLCSIQLESGKVTAYVNPQIAGVIGANIPKDNSSGIAFVAK